VLSFQIHNISNSKRVLGENILIAIKGSIIFILILNMFMGSISYVRKQTGSNMTRVVTKK